MGAQDAERRNLALEVMLSINEPLPGHSDYVFPPPVIAALRTSSGQRLDAVVGMIRQQHPVCLSWPLSDTWIPGGRLCLPHAMP
jgi:hypothetical protein